MRVDDVAAFIAANAAPYIAAHSTVYVPLITPTAAMIEAHNYNDVHGKLMIALEESAETSESLTMTTRDIKQVVSLYIFAQGDTESVLRAQVKAYAMALAECLATSPDFNAITGRDFYDGVEAKADIKAAKLEIEYRWEE